MAIPISTKANGGAGYDIFDWYRLANLTPAGDAFPNDQTTPADGIIANYGPLIYHTGTIQPYLVPTSNFLQLVSGGAGDPAQLVLSTAVPTQYTYEVEFYVDAQAWLPATFTAGKIGVGVFDAQSYGLRLFVSQEGIGYLPQNDPSAAVEILSGSPDLFQYPFHLRLHLVSDGTSGDVTVYATSEDAAGAEIGNAAWVVTAPQVTGPIANVADFYCTGATAVLESLRLSSLQLAANVIPVAQIDAPAASIAGRALQLNGTSSYDPEGKALTYDWELETVPAGATPILGGLVPATVALTNWLSTVTVSTSYKGTEGNLYTIEVLNGTLDFDLTGYAFTVTVPVATTLSEFVFMINDATKYGQPAAISAVFSAELTSGNGTDVVPLTALTSFSGGSDSTNPNPGFIPMVSGTYVIGLAVSDGIFTSAQVLHTLEVSPVDALLETVPDAEFIWDTLPDFWSRVSREERSVFSKIWSSFMQVMSGDTIRAWQDDYAKSLRDIPVKYQRKWVGFPTLIDATGDLTGPEYYSAISATLQDDDDTDTTTQTFLLAGGAEYYSLVETGAYSLFSNADGMFDDLIAQKLPTTGTAEYLLLATEHSAYDTLGSGSSGLANTTSEFHTAYGVLPATSAAKILQIGTSSYYISSLSATDSTTATILLGGECTLASADFVVDSAPFAGVNPGDNLHLRGALPGNSGIFPILLVDPVFGFVTCGGAGAWVAEENIPWGINAEPVEHPYNNAPYCTKTYDWTGLPVTGKFLEWSILEQVETAYQMWGTPYYEIEETPPLNGLAKLQYTVNNTIYYSYVPIRYATDSKVFLDWYSFFRDLTSLDTGDIYRSGFSGGLGRALVANVDGNPNYPNLFATVSELAPTLLGYIATSYVPIDSSILEIPLLKDTIVGDLTYEFPADFTLPTIDTQQYIAWDTTAVTFTWSRTVVSGLTVDPGVIYLANGDALKVYNFDATLGTAAVDYEPPTGGSYTGWHPTVFKAATDVPEIEWAEVVYFDNDETISTNFGAVVGMPKVAQNNYKSDVTALWFCLWNGPTLANLEIAANAIMDRALFLSEGTILSIDATYNASEGRIFLQDSATGLVHAYAYDKTAGIAINPETDVALAVGDTVERYWPINGGITVDDYKSDPDWFDRYLVGQDIVKRYFYFTLKIASGTGVTAAQIDQLLAQIDLLKPQYTDVIFVMVVEQKDDVDVVATHTISATVRMADSPAQAVYTDATPTVELTPAAIATTAIAFPPRYSALPMQNLEVYESCYLPGHLDDYSGDGSWHPNAPGVVLHDSGATTALFAVGPAIRITDGGAAWGDLTGYFARFPTMGPYGLWAEIDSSTPTTFTYTRDATWLPYVDPPAATAYEIYTPTSAVVKVNQLDSDEDHSKSVTWLELTLTPSAPHGFTPNEWVVGATQGRARVLYVQNLLHPENHPKSFILVQRRPEDDTVQVEMGLLSELDFVVGDTITGGTSGETAVVDSIRTYPDYIFGVDAGLMRPDSHPGPTTSFYAPTAAILPTVDYGLTLDDVEPFYDPILIANPAPAVALPNLVPSFDYGQYWWLDTPLTDDYSEGYDGTFATNATFTSPTGGDSLVNYYGAAPGDLLVITGAATAANNGSFTIVSNTPGAPGVLGFAAASFTAPDANDGAIRWHIVSKFAAIDYWNDVGPTNADDGTVVSAAEFSSVSGAANSYNGVAPGDWLIMVDATNPANNAWHTILGVGATLTFAPATLTSPDASSGNIRWCCLPSWYTNTWTPVKVDYVHRDAVVYRYTLAGDRMPNITHGHTWFRTDQWYQEPWVVAIIVSPAV